MHLPVEVPATAKASALAQEAFGNHSTMVIIPVIAEKAKPIPYVIPKVKIIGKNLGMNEVIRQAQKQREMPKTATRR